LRKAGITVYRADEEALAKREAEGLSWGNTERHDANAEAETDHSILKCGSLTELNDPRTFKEWEGKTAAQHFKTNQVEGADTRPDWSPSALAADLAYHWGWRAKNKSASEGLSSRGPNWHSTPRSRSAAAGTKISGHVNQVGPGGRVYTTRVQDAKMEILD
jgi:hypothetical protein